MGLFRKSSAEPLGVAMAGVKLGQRLLAVGARDPQLIAPLAVKAGLTGRAVVVDADPAQLARGAAEMEREGALVEPTPTAFGSLPFEGGSFDVSVISHLLHTLAPDEQTRSVSEVFRVLRPGGRAIVIEPARRTGIAAMLGRQAVPASYAGGKALLQDAGFTAVRVLAETGGATYVEGVRRVDA